MKKLFALLLVCLLALSAVAVAEGQYPVTWSQNLDGNDYEFSVDAAPQKAVSMSQATTEMLLALGLADQMAGTAFLEEEIYEPLAEDYAKVPVLAEKWPAYEVFMEAAHDFTTGWAVPFTQRAIPAADIVAQNIPIFVPQSMLRTDATLDTLFDDLLMYGKIFDAQDAAAQSGMNVRAMQLILILLSALAVSVVVSVSGLVGFVGLIIPHIMRRIVGTAHRPLVAASALAGGCFLNLADTVARTAFAPQEMPIGVMTAFIGAPVFILMIRRICHEDRG